MLEREHRSRVVRGGDLRLDIIEDLPGFCQFAYVRDGVGEPHSEPHAHRLGQALKLECPTTGLLPRVGRDREHLGNGQAYLGLLLRGK